MSAYRGVRIADFTQGVAGPMACMLLGDFEAEVSASMGIAHFPGSATDVDTLLHKADHAMYRAKAEGKRRVCVAG